MRKLDLAALRDSKPPSFDPQHSAEAASRIWEAAGSIAGTLGERYLRARAITAPLPKTLRFAPQNWYEPGIELPAMIARVEGSPGFGIHRTFLDPQSHEKAAVESPKKMLGPCGGGAVRLSEGTGALVVCEGIETGLAVLSMRQDRPTVLAALSANNLSKINLPEPPQSLEIVVDNDEAGRKSANALATRAHALGWAVSLIFCGAGRDADDDHCDANDLLKAGSPLPEPQPFRPARDQQTRGEIQVEKSLVAPEGLRTTESLSLRQMLENFVFISDGSQVASLGNPREILCLDDFKKTYAASLHEALIGQRPIPCSTLWMSHPARLTAQTVTFRAGHDAWTTSPGGLNALNIWRPPTRSRVPEDWVSQAQVFVDHVHWLWADAAEPFLDWLAHIEQRPGELPNYGWLHISRVQGKGRGWLSRVLSQLWRGHVAESFDLVGALESGFNDRLSGCLVAVVEELNEGTNGNYRCAEILKGMITDHVRQINQKYGRIRVEWNSARWLIFSNHSGALPIDVEDRRFWVVDHDDPPKNPDYYQNLFSKLTDTSFIPSVAEYLAQRKLVNFNPGARPPLNAAKRALIAAGRTEEEFTLREIVAKWPVDLISRIEIGEAIGPEGSKNAMLRQMLLKVGLTRVAKMKASSLHNLNSPKSINVPVYAVRDAHRWRTASKQAMRTEVRRATDAEKVAALDCEAS